MTVEKKSGAEAHLSARLQLYHSWIELLVAVLNIGDEDVLVILRRSLRDAVGHGGDDAVLDELVYPSGIAKIWGVL